MIDRPAQDFLKPGLDRLAAPLVRAGLSADAMSLIGFALGLGAAALIGSSHEALALAPLLLSRLCDGLDGAMARQTQPTDRGAFLDITLDFLFYASIPLAFAISNPSSHALSAAALLAAFIGTGSSFLAFAVLAERQGLSSASFPRKGLFYLGGLTEAGETLIIFCARCLWPSAFPLLAWLFAGLCCITIVSRLVTGWRVLSRPQP